MDEEHVQVVVDPISMGGGAQKVVRSSCAHFSHICALNSEIVRMDGVRYIRNDIEQVGIIDSVLQMRRARCQQHFLVRRLMRVEPDVGNRNVVNTYGHNRYRYEVETGSGVMLELVHVRDVSRPCMLVVDPYQFVRVYGKTTRLCEVGDNDQTRQQLCFFEVHGFKYTSARE